MKTLETLPQEIQTLVTAQRVICEKITVLETANYQGYKTVCDYIIEQKLVNYLVLGAISPGKPIISPIERNRSLFSFYEECESFAKLLGEHDLPMPTSTCIWQARRLLTQPLEDFLELVEQKLANGELVID